MKIKEIVRIVKKLKPKQIPSTEFDDIYRRASSFVEDIPKERFEKAIKSVFSAGTEPNEYFQKLDSFKKSVENLDGMQNTENIIAEIEREAKLLVNKSDGFSTLSKQAICTESNAFVSKFSSYYEKLAINLREKMQALMKQNNPEYEKYYNAWCSALYLKYMPPIPEGFYRISELPEGILQKNGILYHGTRNGGKIAKRGLSAYRSNQLAKAPREFGAGIYTTPDKQVAASFARISGRIIPLKADIHKTAFVEDMGFGILASNAAKIANDAGINIRRSDEFSNAARELIISRLFREAGYDSVYTANSMARGLFTKSADEYIGRAQSQMVVFDPSKINLAYKKNLFQKFGDEILQIKSYIHTFISTIKTAYNDPLSALLG